MFETRVSELNPGKTGHMVDKLGICLQQISRGATTLILHKAAWYQLQTALSLEKTCNPSIPNLGTLHRLKPAAAEATSERN